LQKTLGINLYFLISYDYMCKCIIILFRFIFQFLSTVSFIGSIKKPTGSDMCLQNDKLEHVVVVAEKRRTTHDTSNDIPIRYGNRNGGHPAGGRNSGRRAPATVSENKRCTGHRRRLCIARGTAWRAAAGGRDGAGQREC
jgi:hypothetical protein